MIQKEALALATIVNIASKFMLIALLVVMISACQKEELIEPAIQDVSLLEKSGVNHTLSDETNDDATGNNEGDKDDLEIGDDTDDEDDDEIGDDTDDEDDGEIGDDTDDEDDGEILSNELDANDKGAPADLLEK